MKLLFHKDMMALLEERKKKQATEIRSLLETNRKGSNVAYQAVVHGHSPSRADRSRERTVQNMSRQDLKDYWMNELKRDENVRSEK